MFGVCVFVILCVCMFVCSYVCVFVCLCDCISFSSRRKKCQYSFLFFVPKNAEKVRFSNGKVYFAVMTKRTDEKVYFALENLTFSSLFGTTNKKEY